MLPIPPGIPIVHACGRYVVVAKPPGLLSVPGKGEAKQDCVITRVREAFPHAAGPMVVHRLDMETSGLMIVALDADAQRELSGRFERREVEKDYIAIVRGGPDADEGTVDLPLRLDPDNRPRQVVDHIHGRAAITQWRVISRDAATTRLRLHPVTGRSHQLRLHCAIGLGCPIVGDVLYGDGAAGDRLLLHATRLAFVPPGGKERIEVVDEGGF
jgi:tRNA pseudouridine32 synthase / 23S rRNA pseudouridine746 synthase